MKKNLFFILFMFGMGTIPLTSKADSEITNTINPGVHIPHRCPKKVDKISYGGIVGGNLELTFLAQMSNVEIAIYKDGVLVVDDNINVVPELTKTYDLIDYGKGEYTIEVYDNGNEILSASEEIY